jgi:hypothetical protein
LGFAEGEALAVGGFGHGSENTGTPGPPLVGAHARVTGQQWACGARQFNQEWQLQAQGNGQYSITTRNAPGEVLDVTGGGTANGSPIQLWTYGGGTNQQWLPVAVGNGEYKLVGVGSGRCLDVPAASTANGVHLQIYDCNGTAAQAFSLSPQP